MHLIQNSPPQNSTSFPDWVQQVTWLPGLRGQISGLKRQISGLRGQVTCLKGQISGLRGEIQGLRGQISGLRGQILGLGGQISGLRGPGGDARTNKWTDGRMNKSPPVFYRTSSPSGPRPKKGKSLFFPRLSIVKTQWGQMRPWKPELNNFNAVQGHKCLYTIIIAFIYYPVQGKAVMRFRKYTWNWP